MCQLRDESEFRFKGVGSLITLPTPSTKRGRQTLDSLLRAASAEFGSQGFYEASITSIVTAADVAAGTFYTYFDSKLDIYRALVSLLAKQVCAMIFDRLGSLEEDGDIVNALESYIRWTSNERGNFLILQQCQFVEPSLFHKYISRLSDIFKAYYAKRAGPNISSQSKTEALAWASVGAFIMLGFRYGPSVDDALASELPSLRAAISSLAGCGLSQSW